MANERLIDVNKISYHKSGFPKGDGFEQGLDWAFREDIDKLPTVDAVPVVRCCDCLHCIQWQLFADGEVILYCKKKRPAVVGPTDFCSYGERRNPNG